jgi:hypothetical protein
MFEDIEKIKSEIKVLRENKVDQDDYEKEIFDIKDMIEKMNSGEKVEVR